MKQAVLLNQQVIKYKQKIVVFRKRVLSVCSRGVLLCKKFVNSNQYNEYKHIVFKHINAIRTLLAGLLALRGQTLLTITGDIEREHFRYNSTIAANVYSYPRRIIEGIEDHLWRTILGIILFYTGIIILTSLFIDPTWPCFQFLNKPYKIPDFRSINIGFLGAQATLIAVVYPMVVALVGILFNARSTIGGRLSVFFKETEAVVTGGSALLFCATLVIQLYIIDQLRGRTMFAMTALNSVWFIINIYALGFFLIKSFNYIRPQTRSDLFRRYLVNVVWRKELHEIIALNRQINAIYYGYLPSTNKEDNTKSKVLITPFKSNLSEITIHFPQEKQLYDVRFDVLNEVVAGWLRGVEQVAKKSTSAQQVPNLILPLLYNYSYNDNVSFAASSSQHRLDWAGKFLIHYAYRFHPSSNIPKPPTTEEFFKEEVAELIELVEAGRTHEFQHQFKEIRDLHIFLFKISQSIDSDGRHFNYAQMSSTPINFGNLGDSWAGQYRDLFKRVTNHLTKEPEFFKYCTYLGAEIYAAAIDIAPPSALRSINNIPYQLFFILNEWAVLTHKSERSIGGSSILPFELHAETTTIYDGAWRDFVAGWERLASVYYNRSENSWDDLVCGFESLQTHLYNSVRIVGKSVFEGDLLAVNYSSDLLLRWYDTSELNWGSGHSREVWLANKSLITPNLLNKSWSEIPTQLLGEIEVSTVTPKGVFSALIENVWHDATLTLLCTLIRWTTEEAIKPTAVIAARKIINREENDDRTPIHLKSLTTTNEALLSILRITTTGERFEHGYAETINGLASSLNDITQAPLVSSRIYYVRGFHDFDELKREQALLLIILTAGTLSLSRELSDLLKLAISQDETIVRRLQSQLEELKSTIGTVDKTKDGELLSSLGAPDIIDNLDNRCIAVCKLLDDCLVILTTHREEQIRNLPIDPTRLDTIAVAASNTGFEKGTASFPVNLFINIKKTSEQLQSWSWRVRQNRGEFTKPLLSAPVSNEKSWWSEAMRQNVAGVVLENIIDTAEVEEVRADTPETWWSTIKVAVSKIEEMNDKAILIVSGIIAPHWLGEWTWNVPIEGQSQRPNDLNMRRLDNGKRQGYELNLNEIEVYRAPIEDTCSYLIPASLLRCIEFTEYKENQLVLIEFGDDATDPWKGVLKATFAHRITLGDGKITKIRFADEPEEGIPDKA